MNYVGTENRYQYSIAPMCMDDYINNDNVCRVIDAFCESLDRVKMGFKHAETSKTGRPPYDPKILIKLYLYGYLNRINSSGMLAKEATRNIEIFWLIEKQTPSKRTLCYFKEHNTSAIKKVFYEFNKICKGLNLFGGETIAVDSVKIRANNSKHNNHRKEDIDKYLEGIDARIEKYFELLNEADLNENNEHSYCEKEIKWTIEKLLKKKEKYEEYQKELIENNNKEISVIDADSRNMRQGSGKGFDISYNTQVSVDAKNKLIVTYETTNKANDFGQLEKITDNVKEFLEKDEIIVLADAAYHDSMEILKCEEKGTTCIIPARKQGKQPSNEKYHRENFSYDVQKDVYICPEGQLLSYSYQHKTAKGKTLLAYSNASTCRNCPQKINCTKNKNGRVIDRFENQTKIEKINQRNDELKMKYKRHAIVEHPFGTIKWVWGFNRYQTRGFAKVGAENALIFCAYNMRRAINILGIDKIIEAISCGTLSHMCFISNFTIKLVYIFYQPLFSSIFIWEYHVFAQSHS